MAKYQKRNAVLQHGKRTLELKINHGHVYEIENGMYAGHPLYDAKQETELFGRLLRSYVKKGWKLVSDTGLTAAVVPKKPAGVTASAWKWMQSTDEVLAMWKNDEYDNYKDAVEDARDLIKRAPSLQAARVAKLEKMLARVIREWRADAADDPALAAYARGILPAKRPAKKTTTKK